MHDMHALPHTRTHVRTNTRAHMQTHVHTFSVVMVYVLRAAVLLCRLAGTFVMVVLLFHIKQNATALHTAPLISASVPQPFIIASHPLLLSSPNAALIAALKPSCSAQDDTGFSRLGVTHADVHICIRACTHTHTLDTQAHTVCVYPLADIDRHTHTVHISTCRQTYTQETALLLHRLQARQLWRTLR